MLKCFNGRGGGGRSLRERLVSGGALDTLMPIRDIRTSTPSQPVAPRRPMTEPVMMARRGMLKTRRLPRYGR